MSDQGQGHTGIKVTVASLGKQREVTLPNGATIADAICEAGFDSAGYGISVNGAQAALHERPDDGDIMTLVPKVDGGK
jgi:sulfur carrier protein ThiS